MSKDNEITLAQAAEYVKPAVGDWRLQFDDDDPETAARVKRERETGEAVAVLDAMLAAGRRGKTVRG